CIVFLFFICFLLFFFFFSSRRRHTRFDCDWSSDVCSSDLRAPSSWAPATSPTPRCGTSWPKRSRAGAAHRHPAPPCPPPSRASRSEERRVGKEGRSRGAPYQ